MPVRGGMVVNELQKEEILKLPLSIRNWILLRHYLEETWDTDVFCKTVDDYYEEMPLFEVSKLYYAAESRLNDADFQKVLNHLFKAKYRISFQEKPISAIGNCDKY